METPRQNVCEHGTKHVFLSIIGPMVKGRASWPVHQQSLWGGGETQWVISLFGRNTLKERILGVMGTFLGIRHSFPLGTITSSSLEAIGETSRE